ncbi:hypothetical protein [uncultured Lactobacillus sp.]|uniref:hypothetical protein n=1 Tax=uncultured Lactobacillus sp. TaxID=153152 RepID=UPI0025CF1CB8|nr:hypothetical protein [uncultured Lactobacillus sp.]
MPKLNEQKLNSIEATDLLTEFAAESANKDKLLLMERAKNKKLIAIIKILFKNVPEAFPEDLLITEAKKDGTNNQKNN